MNRVLNRLVGWPFLAIASFIGAVTVAYGEHDFQTLAFVFFVFGGLCSAILLLARRPAFAVLAAWLIVAVLTAISAMKLKYMGFSLHAYDLYFYNRDFEVYRFLFDSYLLPLALCLAIMACGVVVCTLIWRHEARRDGVRRKALAACALAFAGAIASYPQWANDQTFYAAGHRTSSFFTSLKDIGELAEGTGFARQLQASPLKTAYDGIPDCSSRSARPDLVAVLMESAVPPSVYPEIKSNPALDRMFQSDDSRVHPLRVETFGGGTWITSAGLMTSLPTTEFGWMRLYLPVYLDHRVHHSLPKLLEACGYKTAVISPLAYPFVNEGPFMTSLGIEDYRDYRAIGAKSKHERDSFYLQAALDYIDQHHRTDPRPLFLFVMTMAAHGPYYDRFLPETVVPGEPFGNDGAMDEYLRRLTMQQTDFKSFLTQLKSRTRGAGAVVLDFGDHQPAVTKELAQRHDSADALGHWDSIAYRTYYRITPVNTALAAPPPEVPVLDVAYLGPTLLQAAGLPLDDVYRELIALRTACNGALYLCADHERIERHLKMLANGKLLELGTPPPNGPILPIVETAAAHPALRYATEHQATQ